MNVFDAIQKRPGLAVVNVVCVVLGVAGGLVFGFEDWPLWRNIAAGVFAGGGVGYLITITRVIGAFEGPEDSFRAPGTDEAKPSGEGKADEGRG